MGDLTIKIRIPSTIGGCVLVNKELKDLQRNRNLKASPTTADLKKKFKLSSYCAPVGK